MKSDKVFIGGMVDARLKRRFLEELRKLNGRAPSRVTQSAFLELLLLESVKLRKRQPKAQSRS